MTKRPSLAAIAVPSKHPAPVGAPAVQEAAVKPRKGEPGYKTPVRENTKAVMGYFDVAVSKQLRFMALERDTTVQALLEEALDDLFMKHGKDQIARTGRVQR